MSEQGVIVRHLRQRLLELVDAGEDVVLDFSFWSRAMREDWRQPLSLRGVVPEIFFVVTSRDTVLRRIRERAAAHSDDFPLDETTAIDYFDLFEPPTDEEGRITVLAT